MGGRPIERPGVFLFADRATYQSYLNAAGLGSHSVVSGLAHRGTNVAVICTEDHPPELVQALTLHELTHLFEYGVSRAVMPSWYSEGLAETFGGGETFSWDGETLEVGGTFPLRRIQPLLEPEGFILLRDLLAADALDLWARDRDHALRFYAQSWALVQYLRTGAGDAIAARFERWEIMCRGAAIGARVGQPDNRNSRGASRLFLDQFDNDLPELEDGLLDWLREL